MTIFLPKAYLTGFFIIFFCIFLFLNSARLNCAKNTLICIIKMDKSYVHIYLNPSSMPYTTDESFVSIWYHLWGWINNYICTLLFHCRHYVINFHMVVVIKGPNHIQLLYYSIKFTLVIPIDEHRSTIIYFVCFLLEIAKECIPMHQSRPYSKSVWKIHKGSKSSW